MIDLMFALLDAIIKDKSIEKIQNKKEFFDKCLEQDMLGYPLTTSEETMTDEQLQSRGLWKDVEHEELGTTITYPSFFTKFSSIACDVWRRAPKIGEHNEEIYAELGYGRDDLLNLKRAKVI